MDQVFETLLGQRRRRPGAVQRFFATHPLTEERLRRTLQPVRPGG